MSCSSGRGQTEPLATLVAVAAVGVALSLYAGALDGALGRTPDPDLAEPTLDRVEETLAPDGVVDPGALQDGLSRGPAGHRLNLTLTTEDHRWTAGPSPATDVRDRGERPVSVRVSPTDVRPGTLRVVVLR